MDTVTLGQKIKFQKTFTDDEGLMYDPDRVVFSIYRVVNLPTFGPYVYDTDPEADNRYVHRVGPGTYELEITIPQQTMPGIYTTEWVALVDDDLGDPVAQYTRTEFQILESLPEPSGLLEPGKLYGIIFPSNTFNEMGIGLTSQLCIVGHCSGLNLNEPHQVANIQETINLIGSNQYSPMVRYLIEAYNAGARDIWLMASAPEREYVQWDSLDLSERFVSREEFDGRNFYEQYYIRYLETMTALAEYDFPDIVVAPDAPFYNTGGIDFLTPLVDSCVDGFVNTGRFRMGFIGSIMGANVTEADYDAIQNDERIDSYGQDGKAVGIFIGEGTINTPHVVNAYTNSCVNIVAATATLDPFGGVMNKTLKGLASPIGKDISEARLNSLANAKVNALVRTSKGKRGVPYNGVLATDNLLADDESAFWSVAQMRAVQEVVKSVRALSNRRIGSVEYRIFKRDVEDYMRSLIRSDYIRDGNAFISRSIEDPYTLNVEITLKPYFGVREIVFTVGVGAGQVIDNPTRSTV